jgi:hypothetical protein
MVKVRFAFVGSACLVVLMATIALLIVTQRQTSTEDHRDFVTPGKSLPTTGGEKMKIEW